MDVTSSSTLPHPHEEEFSNYSCLVNGLSHHPDDSYLKLIPSVHDHSIPSLENLEHQLKIPVQMCDLPENIGGTCSTNVIFSIPDQTQNISEKEKNIQTQNLLTIENNFDQSNSFQSNDGVVLSSSIDFESKSDSISGLTNFLDESEFTKILESLDHSQTPIDKMDCEAYIQTSLIDEEMANFFASEELAHDNTTMATRELSSRSSDGTGQNLPVQSNVMLQPVPLQQNFGTKSIDSIQQTKNILETNCKSQITNNLHSSLTELKLCSPQSQNEEPLLPIQKSTGAELRQNNSMVLMNYSQQKEYQEIYNELEMIGLNVTEFNPSRTTIDQSEFYSNQPNEIGQPQYNRPDQSQVFQPNSSPSVQNLKMQNYDSVHSEEHIKIKGEEYSGQSLKPANKSFKIVTDQPQVSKPMNLQELSAESQLYDSRTKNEEKKSIESSRSHLMKYCNLEDFDQFPYLTFNQYKEILRFEPPQGPSNIFDRERGTTLFGGNKIFQVYNNTIHRGSSNTNSPSQSFEDKNELSKEETMYGRGTVIKRILGKRTEDCLSSPPYGGVSEDNYQIPCKVMQISQDGFDLNRGSKLLHNQRHFLSSEKVKCEVLDFSSTSSLPSTSSYVPPPRNIDETPLLREHRMIRSELRELLEAIDSVILQKGVKEKIPGNEELAEDDINDDKKLKKSLETLRSYFIEASSLYAKHDRREITKDELSKEAKRLKNKFSGMKSRVKKKKEFNCEKKEFLHLVNEFACLKSFSHELETFQSLIVGELDTFHMSDPLGKFFRNTVFSQMNTSNIDPWIKEDYAESVKKLEHF